jgi:cytochrome c553
VTADLPPTEKTMKVTVLVWLAMLGLCAGGCTNLERSRDLANPDVPPKVTAQQVCSNCHYVDGNSVSPNFPRLAAQPKGYLVAQLENFRSHRRSDPAGYEFMWGLTRNLTDPQIDGLAEYFSTQTAKRNSAVDTASMALGKQIFEQGVPDKATPPCAACHGPQGQGLAAFPRLAFQHQDYLIKQLHVFQETEWRPGTPMKQVTHQMSNEEIEAVAAYLQAFPAPDPPLDQRSPP